MEMKPEDLKKYIKQYPSPEPKHGRFSPDRQFFQCETPEQIATLEAAGWNDNPFKHTPPYKPEEGRWVEKWENVVVSVEPPAPAVPQRDLQGELAAALAKIATLEAAKPIGRPRKVVA